MKKDLLRRGLVAAPLGLTIAVFITIVESAIANSIADSITGGGASAYYAVTPESMAFWGGEFNAEVCAFVTSLAYGFMWGSISVIWEIPTWSLTRQTITHLSIAATGSLLFIMANFIMPTGSVFEFVLWYAIWCAIYAVIWLIAKHRMAKAARDVNARLKSTRRK